MLTKCAQVHNLYGNCFSTLFALRNETSSESFSEKNKKKERNGSV